MLSILFGISKYIVCANALYYICYVYSLFLKQVITALGIKNIKNGEEKSLRATKLPMELWYVIEYFILIISHTMVRVGKNATGWFMFSYFS